MNRRFLRLLGALALALPVVVLAVTPPSGAQRWRRTVVTVAHQQFGLNAPIATLAAQLHQESAWKPDARSHAGALGMAQFMPATARDMARLHPTACAPAQPFDPRWAIRCAARYDADLYRAIRAQTLCDRWAMTLSAYNGGLGWVYRDQRTARDVQLNPGRWWGNTEVVNAGRSISAWLENRGYPRRILHTLAPRYVQAGWGKSACPCTAGVVNEHGY